MRTSIFNLAKSFGNTYNSKGVYFLLKNEPLQGHFLKYYPLYFKDIAYNISSIFYFFNKTHFQEHLLRTVSL